MRGGFCIGDREEIAEGQQDRARPGSLLISAKSRPRRAEYRRRYNPTAHDGLAEPCRHKHNKATFFS